MSGERDPNRADGVTAPDVTPAFQMLRAAQDAETQAMESLLLSALTDDTGDVDRATQAIENAIAQHRAAHEELAAIREIYDGDRPTEE